MSSAKPPPVFPKFYPNEKLVFISFIVLSSVLVLFAIFTIPHAIARFSAKSAWKQGSLLLYSPSETRSPREYLEDFHRGPFIEKDALRLRGAASTLVRIPRYDPQDSRAAPPHLPSWNSILYPVSSVLSPRFFGYSLSQLLILFSYAVMFGVLLLIYSDPTINPKRAGWIALSQIPVVFFLGSKNSIVGLLTARGYENLNYIHRWVGRLIFIASLFHVVAFLVLWTKAGTLEHSMTRPVSVWGTVVFGAITLLSVGSLPAIRRWSYTFFFHCHWVGFITLLVSVWNHVPVAVPYTIAAAGIYVLDLLLRTIKSHITQATIHFVPEMTSTRVSIRSVSRGWRAGQHVRLTVLSMGMGFGIIESHPFTIASASDEDEGLVLYCKKAGDWTAKLGALAAGGITAKSSEAGLGAGRNVSVIVQGPYGGPGHVVFSSYSAAMVVCGGSGITFGLATVKEIMRDAFDQRSRVRLVDLIWVVRDPSYLIPLLPTFTKLSEQAACVTSVSLHIAIHYTRASSEAPVFALPEGTVVQAGRPELRDVLYASLSCVSALKNKSRSRPHGVIVGVCGPKGLVEEVRKVERGVGKSVRKAVGGIELVDEAFGW